MSIDCYSMTLHLLRLRILLEIGKGICTKYFIATTSHLKNVVLLLVCRGRYYKLLASYLPRRFPSKINKKGKVYSPENLFCRLDLIFCPLFAECTVRYEVLLKLSRE